MWFKIFVVPDAVLSTPSLGLRTAPTPSFAVDAALDAVPPTPSSGFYNAPTLSFRLDTASDAGPPTIHPRMCRATTLSFTLDSLQTTFSQILWDAPIFRVSLDVVPDTARNPFSGSRSFLFYSSEPQLSFTASPRALASVTCRSFPACAASMNQSSATLWKLLSCEIISLRLFVHCQSILSPHSNLKM